MKDFNFDIFGEYSEKILISFAIFLLVGIVIWLINKGANFIKKRVNKLSTDFFKIQSIEIISTPKLQLIYLGVINTMRIIIILLAVNFSFLLVFSLFPGTKDFVNKLFDLIFVPLKDSVLELVNYLPNLFKIIVIILIFHYLKKLVKKLALEVYKGTISIAAFHPQWAKTSAKIINFLLFAFMLIMIFPLMPGYQSLAFKGVATFLAALITIGGSSIIANYMAGIVISYMNPCKIGDWIQIDNTTGEVVEMAEFALKIRTSKNVLISIPYTKGLSSHIINYSGDKKNDKILLHTTVSIGYEVTWQKVNELLLAAAKITEGLIHSPPPFVNQVKLDDFYVEYELNAYTSNPRKMMRTYSNLHKNILNTFREAGVAILSPHVERQL